MPEPRQVQRVSTYLLSAVMLVLGVTMIVLALVRGGGPLATGIVFGVLFTAAGAGRLYVERRRSQ